ncbi:MAG TPA: hypothetical protein VFB62_22885 [Polyangiaceae bacterium]|nr:hypothetical protein [Polyangiaceae bacterium]
MSYKNEELTPERVLVHPLWLGSLALLAANDQWFKGAGLFHHLVTGKLSDVAGMVVAPALLAVLVRARSRRAFAACHVATGACFAAIKLSTQAAGVLVQTMSWLGQHWKIWTDPTDLLVLPMLFVSFRILLPAAEQRVGLISRARQLGQLVAATGGLLACLGTSSVPPEAPPQPPPPAVAAAPNTLSLTSLQGARWTTESDGFRLSYRFEGDSYTTTGNPPWEESGRVELISSDAQQMRVRFVDRVFDGKADESVERVLEMSADGQSFQMDGRAYRKESHEAVIAAE